MKDIYSLILTLTILISITFLTTMYSEGWRLDILNNDENNNIISKPRITKTGMLAIRSIPEGAKIYLNNNEEAITATDDTISSLKPGKYFIKLEKEGFETWSKEVTVYSELVTDITAVLILHSPKLDPLTNTDVKAFDLSSDRNNIAFITKNQKNPGIWTLPLSDSPINLFRNNINILIEDYTLYTPSLGEKLYYSPDDKELLVQLNKSGHLLYELTNQTSTKLIPKTTTDINQVFSKWETSWKEDFLNPKNKIIEEQNAPDWINDAINNKKTYWAPDDEKFLFYSQNQKDSNYEDIVIYNLEDPLPVDENRINIPLKINKNNDTKIYWYSDSYHLIIVENNSNLEEQNQYTISLIRIDGSNRTVVYTGTLASDQAYPTPNGDKIIVLTSLKEGASNNIYAIAIR